MTDHSNEPRGRILCVTTSFPRWEDDSTTPFVLHLAQDLQRLGWAIDVLAPHAPGAATAEAVGGVHVERFRYLWPSSAETVCYQGGALVNLRRNRRELLKVPPLVAAEWLAVLHRLLRRRYDALHSHWILPQGLVGALSARPLGIPHLVTVHGGDIFALRGRLFGALKRHALGAADAVTVNSSATERAVRALQPRLGEVARIPMGVAPTDAALDPADTAALRARHRRGQGPLLVFVGRLVEEKGCADLLAAAAILADRLPELGVLVVGDGPERSALEGLADRPALRGRVHFAGWLQPHAVSEHLAAADIFVGPSRTGPDGWVEAQGLTFIEAMMAGTAVIATRSGGIADAVVDGHNGLLVDEAAPQQIADAVTRLATDPVLRARLAAQGHSDAVARYSREASAAAFSTLLQRLTTRRRTRGGADTPG